MSQQLLHGLVQKWCTPYSCLVPWRTEQLDDDGRYHGELDQPTNPRHFPANRPRPCRGTGHSGWPEGNGELNVEHALSMQFIMVNVGNSHYMSLLIAMIAMMGNHG